MTLNAIGLLRDVGKISRGASHIRTGSFKLGLRASSKSAVGSLPLLIGSLQLTPQVVNGMDSFAEVQIVSEMGKTRSRWTARASTNGETRTDGLMFGKVDQSKTAVSIRDYAAIDFPVDMQGEAEGIMSVSIRISVGII